MKPKQYQAVFLDLFGTIVDFDWSAFPRVTWRVEGAEKTLPSTGGLLLEHLSLCGNSPNRDRFFTVFFELQKKHRETWDAGVTEEISCDQKMRELAGKLGITLAEADINRLVEVHMEAIVNATVIPPKRREAILRLGDRFPLALVSNFDHGRSGRAILTKHGIDPAFSSVVISDDLGKRKPHRQLFEKAAADLQKEPRDILMVGDSPLADIAGAAALGMDTAWIRQDTPWPAAIPRATLEIVDLADLPEALQPAGSLFRSR